MITIAHLQFPSYVALAPMAGITDLPFRNLCQEMGAGLAVSEMTHSDPRLRNSKKTRLRTYSSGKTGIKAIQIVGGDPVFMADTASYNVDRGAELIDINMGCPAKKVLKKAAGSALLSNETLVRNILRAVVGAVNVPVTLKFRTGPRPSNRNGVRIAQIAEDCGVSALAVHGRTRECRFNGRAEYSTIAEIVKAVRIPVFANGDIDSPKKAESVMSFTRAKGIMLGRSVLGAPWICGHIDQYLKTGINPKPPNLLDRIEIMERHIKSIHSFYGNYWGVRLARKHVGWYLKHMHCSLNFGKHFNSLNDPSKQIDLVRNLSKNNVSLIA